MKKETAIKFLKNFENLNKKEAKEQLCLKLKRIKQNNELNSEFVKDMAWIKFFDIESSSYQDIQNISDKLDEFNELVQNTYVKFCETCSRKL